MCNKKRENYKIIITYLQTLRNLEVKSEKQKKGQKGECNGHYVSEGFKNKSLFLVFERKSECIYSEVG